MPGVNLEIVALDFNIVDEHKTCPWIACGRKSCDFWEAAWPGCNLARCKAVMQKRGEYAFDLLKERVDEVCVCACMRVHLRIPADDAFTCAHARLYQHTLQNPVPDLIFTVNRRHASTTGN